MRSVPLPTTHPILGDELRALRRLRREQEPKSPFVFTSEREAPFTTAGFARMVERAGSAAKLGFKAHPHMLRHTFVTTSFDAGVDLRDVQIAARHVDPRITMRYDRARTNLDRHPNYILAAYMSSAT